MTDTSNMGRGEPPADQAEGEGEQGEYAEQRANYDMPADVPVDVLTDPHKHVPQPPAES